MNDHSFIGRAGKRKAVETPAHIRTAKYEPPARVWEPSARRGKWTSREWRDGEKKKYARVALGMEL